MEKKKIQIMLGAVVAILAVAVLIFYGYSKWKARNDYSVVYLTTGEVYIGRLSTFPKMTLRDGYILQNVKDQDDATKSNFQIVPLAEALWAPKKLYLNEKNVVFYGPILETSNIAKSLRDAGKK